MTTVCLTLPFILVWFCTTEHDQTRTFSAQNLSRILRIFLTTVPIFGDGMG